MRLDKGGVIMASSTVSGNHWSCVHINLETGDRLYADLLGRQVPRNFGDTFSNYFLSNMESIQRKDFIKSMHVANEIQ